MSKRETLLLLDDMFQSAQKIKRYTKDLDFDSFLSDDKTLDAVVRNFEIIGEAAIEFPQILEMKTQKLNGKEFVDFAIE